jgi:ribosomal protein S18 acetylase RimI-like enzyme
VAIRTELQPEDREALKVLLEGTGFFNAGELEVALELVDDRLKHGEGSHYRFLVLEEDGKVRGYAAWGPIPGTVASADLYWIAVEAGTQRRGFGRKLLHAAEEAIVRLGRTRVYLETSTRAQYEPTRAFYLRCGYKLAAEFPDFYAPGDGKAVFLKVLPPGT